MRWAAHLGRSGRLKNVRPCGASPTDRHGSRQGADVLLTRGSTGPRIASGRCGPLAATAFRSRARRQSALRGYLFDSGAGVSLAEFAGGAAVMFSG